MWMNTHGLQATSLHRCSCSFHEQTLLGEAFWILLHIYKRPLGASYCKVNNCSTSPCLPHKWGLQTQPSRKNVLVEMDRHDFKLSSPTPLQEWSETIPEVYPRSPGTYESQPRSVVLSLCSLLLAMDQQVIYCRPHHTLLSLSTWRNMHLWKTKLSVAINNIWGSVNHGLETTDLNSLRYGTLAQREDTQEVCGIPSVLVLSLSSSRRGSRWSRKITLLEELCAKEKNTDPRNVLCALCATQTGWIFQDKKATRNVYKIYVRLTKHKNFRCTSDMKYITLERF